MTDYTILVCDDDSDIVEAISIYLAQENYKVLKAYNGNEAVEISKIQKIHLILMDIMMPKLDGLSATRLIRENSNVPIIFLSAKSEDTDKIIGLNFGADDYITKPFNPLELMARVRAQLRRYTKLGNIENHENIIINGDLIMDLDKKTLLLGQKHVVLTATEWKIVELMMKNLGKVYSIDEIYENVWQEEAFIANNTIAVHIRRIREKIEIEPKNPKYLKVVWGIGYKIDKVELPSII